jgi:hypothetical protein
MDKQHKSHYLQSNNWTRFTRTDERRAAPRYPAKSTACWLVWGQGDDVSRQRATIVDFSVLGARIETHKRPSKEGDLRLEIESAEHLGELGLAVVKLEKSFLGPYHARCTFPTPADYELFKAVVYGVESVGWQPEELSREWKP